MPSSAVRHAMLRPNDTLAQEFCGICRLQPILGTPSACNLWEDSATATGAGWTDNGDGSYTCDGSAGSLLQATATGLMVDGASYRVSGNVSAYTSGTLRVNLFGPDDVGVSMPIAASGVFEETVAITTTTATTVTNEIRLVNSVSFIGTVRDFEVSREL